MFESWGRIVFRHRRLVPLVAALPIAVGAASETGVFGALQTSGRITPPSSPGRQ